MAELERAAQEEAAERARVAELEARLAELERKSRERASTTAARDNQRLLDRLDRLVMLNEELLSRSQAPHVRDVPGPAAPSVQGGAAVDRSPACDEGLTPEQQIRRLVERMRHRSGWRGGLSREESEALRVLLRPERVLDSSNPLEEWQ